MTANAMIVLETPQRIERCGPSTDRAILKRNCPSAFRVSCGDEFHGILRFCSDAS